MALLPALYGLGIGDRAAVPTYDKLSMATYALVWMIRRGGVASTLEPCG